MFALYRIESEYWKHTTSTPTGSEKDLPKKVNKHNNLLSVWSYCICCVSVSSEIFFRIYRKKKQDGSNRWIGLPHSGREFSDLRIYGDGGEAGGAGEVWEPGSI